MAHGLGTYLDPFALDVGDPLVEQLAQTDFRPAAVYSVVFAFNRRCPARARADVGDGAVAVSIGGG